MTGGLEVGVGGAFGSLQVLYVCYATDFLGLLKMLPVSAAEIRK